MHADEEMDALLRDAMRADVPSLSPGFDDRVLSRVRPRRLTVAGRVVLGAYATLSLAACAWAFHGVPLTLIVGSTAAGVVVATAAGLYGMRVTSRAR